MTGAAAARRGAGDMDVRGVARDVASTAGCFTGGGRPDPSGAPPPPWTTADGRGGTSEGRGMRVAGTGCSLGPRAWGDACGMLCRRRRPNPSRARGVPGEAGAADPVCVAGVSGTGGGSCGGDAARDLSAPVSLVALRGLALSSELIAAIERRERRPANDEDSSPSSWAPDWRRRQRGDLAPRGDASDGAGVPWPGEGCEWSERRSHHARLRRPFDGVSVGWPEEVCDCVDTSTDASTESVLGGLVGVAGTAGAMVGCATCLGVKGRGW